MEKTEDAFTSGKQAEMVRANNNALEHLDLFDQARVALANNNLPVLNRIANAFGVQLGSDAKTTFDHIGQRVSEEVSKAFLPGGGGQAERAGAMQGYGSNMGDQQLQSNIRADVKLMDSQQRNLQDQYQRGTYGKGAQQLFTNEAMAARNRLLGVRSGPGGVPAPGTQGNVGQHIIRVPDPNTGTVKRYQYKGSGNTADLNNYTELK